MHRSWSSSATSLAAIGLLAALSASAPLAHGATRKLDTFSLVAGQRGWDSRTGTTACPMGLTGYTPVENGASLAAGTLRGDAFDGGLLFGVDGNGFDDGDGKGQFGRRANTLKVGPTATGGLRVARSETASGPYLRSLVTLRNTGGAAFTGAISWESNLGSDGDEITQASSSGDKAFTTADRWVVSGESPPLRNPIDPVLVFALHGRGAVEKVDEVSQGPGTGCLRVEFQGVRVPSNATRYLLFYTEMHPATGGATRSARKYDRRGLSRGLLKGIGAGTRAKILNWSL
jgi:hypothetical protein